MSTDQNSLQTAAPSTARHPKAEPFWYGQGEMGILLIHGFGGSAGDYHELGQELAAAGYLVHGMCVAGHGQTSEVLGTMTMVDWRNSVEAAAREVRAKTRKLFVIGFSFGGALGLHLAANHPEWVDGVVTVNTGLRYRGGGGFQVPLLKILRRFKTDYQKKGLSPEDQAYTKSIGSLLAWPIDGILENYKFLRLFVEPQLPHLRTPLLVVYSAGDHVIDPATARLVYDQAGSAQKEFWELPLSSHRPVRDPAVRKQMVEQFKKFITTSLAVTS